MALDTSSHRRPSHSAYPIARPPLAAPESLGVQVDAGPLVLGPPCSIVCTAKHVGQNCGWNALHNHAN